MHALPNRNYGNERIARMLITDKIDSTSQGPVNEIRLRSSGRLGGTIGVETEESIKQPAGDRTLRPIEDTEGINFVSTVVKMCIEDIRAGRAAGGATRMTIKTVVSDEMLARLSETVTGDAVGASIEGSLSVGDGYNLVYLGYNEGSRRLPQEQYESLISVARSKEAYGTESSTAEKVMDRIRNTSQATYRLFDNKTSFVPSQDYNDIAELLKTFEYSYGSAIRNITAPSNTIALAYGENNNVVGVALTETSQIVLANGRVLHTVELTDFVVHPDYRDNKISYVLAAMLIENIFSGNIDHELHTVFAESNVSNGIITTFAMFGGEVANILQNHVNVVTEDGTIQHSFALMQFRRGHIDAGNLSSVLRRAD